MSKVNDKTKTGEEISKVVYEPKAEKWHGVYYPGLPFLPLTDEELAQLAKVHGYEFKLVHDLYAIRKEEGIKDASNAFA
jgi:hypothetical protein